jgi:hypothetical protein
MLVIFSVQSLRFWVSFIKLLFEFRLLIVY